MNFQRQFSAFARIVGLVAGLTITTVTTGAIPSTAMAQSSPILIKRVSIAIPSGGARTSECLVTASGTTITRSYNGVITIERKDFSLQVGTYEKTIDDAASAKQDVKVSTPFDTTYSMIANRTTATGTEPVLLGSIDGVTGKQIFNNSVASYTLREILNSACGN
jgi:hypothetical protein